MGFSTPSYDLRDLFVRVERGDIQFPDFQRPFLWNMDRVRSLLVTALRGYPIGAFTALDTRNQPMRLRPRAVIGAEESSAAPGLLLLDGQQRLSALYMALAGDGVVKTKDFRNKKVNVRFFVNVDRAVSGELMPDEAVFAVDTDGRILSHFGPAVPGTLSDEELLVTTHSVPVASILTGEATANLLEQLRTADDDASASIKKFISGVATPLASYRVPVMELARETSQAGLGPIFAQANAAGLQLGIVELVTSLFAAQDPEFRLRDHWRGIREVLHEEPVLREIHSHEFLQAISLLVTARDGHSTGHRADILNLNLEDYLEYHEVATQAFLSAARFLTKRAMFTSDDLPYPRQIIALAVILGQLESVPGAIEEQVKIDRVHRWFWSGVFGELYGSPNVVTRIGYDVDQVTPWVLAAGTDHDDVPEPKTVSDAVFHESRLLSVDPESGVYKGISALLQGRGARDWRTTKPFCKDTVDALEVEFAEIFPASWCRAHNVDPVVAGSVLNRTPMSKGTRSIVGSTSPSRYLPRMQAKSLLDDAEFDELLDGHALDPELLRGSRASEFFAERRDRFLRMIEVAMGRAADRDVDEANLSSGAEGPDAFEADESE